MQNTKLLLQHRRLHQTPQRLRQTVFTDLTAPPPIDRMAQCSRAATSSQSRSAESTPLLPDMKSPASTVLLPTETPKSVSSNGQAPFDGAGLLPVLSSLQEWPNPSHPPPMSDRTASTIEQPAPMSS